MKVKIELKESDAVIVNRLINEMAEKLPKNNKEKHRRNWNALLNLANQIFVHFRNNDKLPKLNAKFIVDFDSEDMKNKIEESHRSQQRILDRKRINVDCLELTVNI
jgi:hypothetical protein